MHSRACILSAVVLAATLFEGIAPAFAASRDTPAASAAADPWEQLNRRNYAIEGTLDRHVIGPAARFYHKITPGPIGRGIHNVLVNLSEPVVIINDVLQLRFKRAGESLARLLTNSTVGLAGLFDVAGRAGLPHHGNEFGVTLGRYGVPSGPYMYVPLVGPSTVRDLVGTGVDLVMNPLYWVTYPDRTEVGVGQTTVGGLDTRVMTEDELDALLRGAVDPYATLRSVYLQNKKGEVEGESEGVPEELPSFDEPPDIEAPPAPHGKK